MQRRVILNFHGVGNPKRTLEPGEAVYWISSTFFDETLELAYNLKDHVDTCVTFDDGNSSDVIPVAEILRKHGRTAKFFVLSGRLGKPGSLTPENLCELVKAGHEIGSHGAEHVDWTTLDDVGRYAEWEEARKIISGIVGAPVTEAAIPFGRYNARVVRGLRKAGYEKVYSSDGGPCTPGGFLFPRTSIRSDMSLDTVEAILLGREKAWRKIRRRLVMTIKARC